MGQTKEQRVIKQITNPSSNQKFTAIATDMFLPNHSGISSFTLKKGLQVLDPVNNNDAVNKKYVNNYVSDFSSVKIEMNMGYIDNLTDYESFIETLLSKNYDTIRTSLRNYTDTSQVSVTKQHVGLNSSHGLRSVWGISANALTSTTWVNYRLAVLDAALWAQNNSVYEFQIGNELENSIDGVTLTADQLVINLKDLATDVKKIFNIGKVSYSFGASAANIARWIAAGKGDLDLLAFNLYRGSVAPFNSDWEGFIDDMYAEFTEDTYISEFNLSSTSLASWSADQATQRSGLTEMINYIIESGIKRASFFTFYSDTLGCRTGAGVYKEIWTYILSLFNYHLVKGWISTEKLRVNHIGEKTAAHNVVFDNEVEMSELEVDKIITPRSLQIFGDFRGMYNCSANWKLLDMARGALAYPDGITITSWYLDCSSDDPTTEINANLKYCDAVTTGAFPGANQVLIDVLDTTTGNSSETDMGDSDLGSGAIPANKILYLSFDANPTDYNTTWSLVINYVLT